MKKLLQLFSGISLLFFSLTSFAATNIFTIPPQDLSMNVLNRVFGSIGTLLYGQVSQTPIGSVLRYFNNAALVLGGIVILYSLIVSTVNTAHDGEMLGKKWNSVWIPVRAALGFALLLPTTAGYAVIQVFVMWVVVQGVGAADYLWENTVTVQQNYTPPATTATQTNTGNPVFGSIPTTVPQNIQVSMAANIIYLSEICQSLLSVELGNAQAETTDTGNSFQFGVQGQNPADICGSVAYEDDAKSNVQSLVNNIKNGPVSEFLSFYDMSDPQALTTQQTESIQSGIYSSSMAYSNTAVNDQINQTPTSSQNSDLSPAIQNAVKGGWLTAGGFYMTLSEMGGTASQTVNIYVPAPSPPSSSNLSSILGQDAAAFASAIQTAFSATCLANPASSSCTPQTINDNTGVDYLNVALPSGITGMIMMFISPMYSIINAVIVPAFMTAVYHGVDQFASGYNPINDMMNLGLNLVNGVTLIFAAVLGIIALIGLISYTCSCVNPCGYAIGQVLSWILPFFILGIGAMWFFGSIAAYYVPMIPYILFTFGGIAWVIAVIEAMVAAPIVALGIVYPEGQHDIFGSASAGVMLLASVFLRPALMIVGFWASYVMVSIAVGIINGGFEAVVKSMVNAQSGGSTAVATLWGFISFVAIYILVVLVAIQKSFSLIYEIPDKVLRWIGGPTEQSGIAQELQEVKGGYEKGTEQAKQGAQQAQKGSQETAQEYQQQKSKQADAAGGSTGVGGSS